MRRPAPTRRATSAVPEAVPPPRATSDRLQYETRWPRILLTKGSRPSSQFSASPRLSHARLFQAEVANSPDIDEWNNRIERGLVHITNLTRLEIGFSAP